MREDKPIPGRQSKDLSDETVARAKARIVHGVGYGKPPQETRFQKGQSGNPGGRPRAARADGLRLEDQPLLQAVHDRAEQSVRMREGETVTEVSARQALVQSVLATALKGNARSQGLALDLIRAADLQRARDRAERQEFAKDFKLGQSRKQRRAIEAGEDTRLILPHPDDIVIDEDHGFHIAGPVDEAELRAVEQTVRYRDALIMQDILDKRLGGREATELTPSREHKSGALLFAITLDRTLPLRFRIDDTAIILRQMRYEGINLRQLLKDTYGAWRAAGVPVKRGARFVDLPSAQRSLAFAFEFAKAFREKRLDVDAMARSEFDEAAVELMRRHGIEA